MDDRSLGVYAPVAAPPADPAPPPFSPRAPAPAQPSLLTPEGDRVRTAAALAQGCRSLGELARVLEAFEGCSLKDTANSLCFADGSGDARVMLVGEAPGAEEDRQGRPFCGPSGRLLDRMLGTIGLDRRHVWITNMIYWRPPGNRTPTPAEIALCQPFLERQIELLRPGYIVFLGGIAARALLNRKEGITRLRGQEFAYGGIPVLAMFHPAYLLRQPLQKKLAWRDLVTLRKALEERGLFPATAIDSP
ncbi:MAG: uracil-DNA glycosylase [Geminicoccaceae bacterium]|nr:uracil-DNA glycosylase [Geminicoccaceae bacterium]